ncbi:MAG: RNA polymerase subunit sigma-70 [Proteobacteria bacterium]|nr:RNA polymerase subunit sigma-70 [Pseudomonadota bacterium]
MSSERSGPAAAARAVELAARDSYGRLVAWLTSRCGDIAMAEDAMADALERALLTWPEQGIPARPETWLLTTARRRVIDGARRKETRTRAVDRLRVEAEEAVNTPFRRALPDRRLELMVLCAHPDIGVGVRTPLILQTVLGLDAKRIGEAFLVAPATMGQRLVRAKRQIRDMGLSLELPEPSDLGERLPHVLEAIYAAYGTGWDGAMDEGARGLSEEALWLARLVVHALPEEPEALGLLALISFAESRRAARRTPGGLFIPLDEQDTALWDHDLMLEGEKAVWIAAKYTNPGRFQIEASIQSVHAHRARSGRTDWPAIHRMYATLTRFYPSIGATIGYAASFGSLDRVHDGLAVLDGLSAEKVARHQPYWAVRAHLLRRAGDVAAADIALERAIGLSEDPAVRAWLLASRT